MEWKKGVLQRVYLGRKGESYSAPASYSNEETVIIRSKFSREARNLGFYLNYSDPSKSQIKANITMRHISW